MCAEYGREMSAEEIEAFLTETGHGVLSLGRDHSAYGVPVSFGYHAGDRRCVLQFGFGEESRKREFAETAETVCLTTYEWSDPGSWQSVVIEGTLSPLSEEALTEAASVFSAHAAAVALTVFDAPLTELDIEWYELDVESISGRRAQS